MPVHVVLGKEAGRSGQVPVALCGAKVEGVFIRALKSRQHASKYVCAACRARALGQAPQPAPRP